MENPPRLGAKTTRKGRTAMAASEMKGNCFECGVKLPKTAMKTHVLKAHGGVEDGEACYLLKVESSYDKGYWLYLDVPLTADLADVDAFLRDIWLECCDHLSAFSLFNNRFEELPNTLELRAFPAGTKLRHRYDFGSTTETHITFVTLTLREDQLQPVRLLARNVPKVFSCAECGQPADTMCWECNADGEENPFFCPTCGATHEHLDICDLIPIPNSPRIGVCGYTGDNDVYTDPPEAEEPEEPPKAKARGKAKAAPKQ
jgi:hypothetical protein